MSDGDDYILLIEDDELWTSALSSSLISQGLPLRVASNWLDAIRIIRDRMPGRVIADLSVNSTFQAGIDALSMLSEGPSPDVLIITAGYSEKIAKKCLAFPFVRGVVPKNKLAKMNEEIGKFVGRAIDIQYPHLDRSYRKTTHDDRQLPNARRAQLVFVVYGRDEQVRSWFFSFLRAIGLEPLEWDQAVALTGKASPYIGEVIEWAMKSAQAVLILLTGDDEAKLRDIFIQPSDGEHETRLTPQPRPNVLFEAGYALGRFPSRTLIVQARPTRPFSDIFGRHFVIFDGNADARNRIVNLLADAGCILDRTGSDWLNMKYPN